MSLQRNIRAVSFLGLLCWSPCAGLLLAQQSEQQTDKKEPAALPTATVKIAWVGDVLMEAHWRKPPLPPGELFDGVREVLRAADIAVCNLESPLTEWPHATRLKSRALVAAGRDYILRTTSAEAAPALRDAGIDIAGLANNHTMDYGERGMIETLERLDAAGVVPVGGGANLAEAEKLRVVEVKGLRIGFLAFSDVVPPGYQAKEDWPGIASAKDVERMRETIARAKSEVDFLAVLFHWGAELARMPSTRQKQLAQVTKSAGADLILGSHPHVLQPVGCLGKTPVVYSAGNFVFPTSRALAQRTAIFEIEVARAEESAPARAFAVRILPGQISLEGKVQMAEGSKASGWAAEILREMARGARMLGAKLEGDVVTCALQEADQSNPKNPPQSTKPRKKTR